ncbi:succinate dehydrogenase cytochrome b560 subunit like protein [Zymoseptoria brevis]|uniref:Succinate dehydrogenase cytochrome b560 subunit like protein n=1 Tax=Zymoseptoria brevis TaxID=1047168 RepID=A0A0F4GKZ0_9PEZI|nr:succinate dehydrogenase cytochrome b560 subunit like protein [Zymoseptoria brevis]
MSRTVSRRVAQRAFRQDGPALSRSVYQPFSKTFVGRQQQQQQRFAATSPSHKTPAGPKATSPLVRQRLHRPIAPHLTTYRWRINMVLSGLNRITGLALSGTFYAFGAIYLIWHSSIETIASGFAALPVVLQVAAKFGVALPFTFHCFSGVSHLVWDAAKMITNRQVSRMAWVVAGSSVGSAMGLAGLL